MRRLALFAALALAACSGSDTPAMDGAEFQRRLRLGARQIRLHLPDAARAELDRCAEARPADPELLVQLARLELLPGEGGPAAARAPLATALLSDPGHAGAHRLLFDLALEQGDKDAREEHREAFVAAYGPAGELELELDEAYHRDGSSQGLVFRSVSPLVDGAAPYRELAGGFAALQRAGRYDPEAGVRAIEAVLAAHPELAAIRHQYVRMLDLGQVRIPTPADASLPPISSKVTLDLAQMHLEDAYDRISPSSRLANELLRGLARVALQMAEYDDAFVWLDLALADERLSPAMRTQLVARQGLVRMKQERYDEAFELLVEALAGGAPRRADLWLLHLVRRATGRTDGPAFAFRPDLELAPPDADPDFIDIAAALGVDKLDGLGPSAWSDYDVDGDQDLFVCGCDSYGVLLRDDGERFHDASREAGLERVQSGYSATFADVDGDGRPDLYIGRDGWNGPAPNSLFLGTAAEDGAAGFRDVTEASGTGDAGSSFVHVWSDVDRDGDVDLYVANGITGGGDTNTLYVNDGAGVFADGTGAARLREKRGTKTIGVAVGDYDGDGWPDLFCSGYQTTNRLYRNRGDGTFEERAKAAGVLGADHVSTGYVSFFADVDNDLDVDIVRTSLAQWDDVLLGLSADFERTSPARRARMDRDTPRLYRNRGDGTFTDATAAAGLVHPIGIMGAGVADLDNDGWVDLYFGTGDPDIGRLEPDRYLRNQGGGVFRDLTFAAGLGNLGKGHGVTFVDRDGDGDLEIYAPEGGFVHGDPWRNAFYDNRHADGNRWLHVELEGTRSNRDGIDAKVLVTTGDRTQLRERKSGEGFGSTGSSALEFGLGDPKRVDRVEVRWPSGEVQVFDDVPLDARIYVKEGEPWERR
ncbi:MAG: FG-GAP-like repeat-containing protein [Planctomycetota bacterium]